MKVGMICRWKAEEFHTVESQGRRVTHPIEAC
jgi:hypothetical protein